MAPLLPVALCGSSLSIVEPFLVGQAWLWSEKFLLCPDFAHLHPVNHLHPQRHVF